MHTGDDEYLGTLGPIIRAEVGDTIEVTLTNNTSINVSLHPHGVSYLKDSEGAFYEDGTTGADKADDIVVPGGTHTYIWEVPESAGPTKNQDPSSLVWVYHSNTPNVVAEIQSGLSGVLIITRKGEAKADGSPKDVDKEFVVLYAVFDENRSMYASANVAKCGSNPLCGLDNDEFHESNLMHSINGLLWADNNAAATNPLYAMNTGDRVRWYVGALGSEVDLHTAHWHGNTVIDHSMHRTDVAEVLPGAWKVYDMRRPENAGEWIFHCHVEDHVAAGMATTYKVSP